MQIINKLFSYLRSALSEANGTGSYNRISGFLLILAWIVFGFMILLCIRQFGELYLTSTTGLIFAISGLKTIDKATTKNTTGQALPPSPENQQNEK